MYTLEESSQTNRLIMVRWGSDWPHVMQNLCTGARHSTMATSPRDLLLAWVPDEAQRGRVLVSYPARLYG
jgi:predicted TIM-barrel fold metal-dependent hydrolase